ncbi:MAG: VOC family protein [Flavobacteriales bacterium]|nr:VOC family protein [Flavobacteriales bacterium]
MSLRPFHLAIPVSNIEKARDFYGNVLGFEEGRSSEKWIDWNFYGHQLVTHEDKTMQNNNVHNPVDGQQVPIPHFGVVLSIDDWNPLAEKLKNIGTKFLIEPYTRFKGESGEQATLFFLDPFGNALEFKAFNNLESLFAK